MTMKLKEILNTGIIDANHNGLRKQTVILENEKHEKFRIAINHIHPTCVLSKWSDSQGWMYVMEKNTVKDYGVDNTYRDMNRVSQSEYSIIINDFKKYIEHF